MGEKITIINHPVIFFDSICVLCSRIINFLIKIDKNKRIRYSGQNSKLMNQILEKKFQKLEIPESIILLYKGEIFIKSAAIFTIADILGGVFKVINIFKFIPSKILDYFYDKIAANRYRYFGKLENCFIIPDEKKELFLD